MLDALTKLLALVGAVSVVVSPFLWAWFKMRIHAAVADAPAMLVLGNRVATCEVWQRDNAEDVKAIPRLAVALEKFEKTLDMLTGLLLERGLSAPNKA